MLRIYIAQIAYNYSDPGMENALHEVASLRQFCRVELDCISDESSILRFWHIQEKYDLAKRMFELINQQLIQRELFLKQSTIIDASLIAAPSSTKNAKGEQDLQMYQSKKGNYYFGAKVHIGIDSETGLVHTLKLTSGNVAEAHNLLSDKEKELLIEAGYQGPEKRPEM